MRRIGADILKWLGGDEHHLMTVVGIYAPQKRLSKFWKWAEPKTSSMDLRKAYHLKVVSQYPKTEYD
jgi:hypothetical protein